MSDDFRLSRFKMVKVECEFLGRKFVEYINPKEVLCVYSAGYYGQVFQGEIIHTKACRSKIRMHNGDTIHSHKEPAELIAEIEAAANG